MKLVQIEADGCAAPGHSVSCLNERAWGGPAWRSSLWGGLCHPSLARRVVLCSHPEERAPWSGERGLSVHYSCTPLHIWRLGVTISIISLFDQVQLNGNFSLCTVVQVWFYVLRKAEFTWIYKISFSYPFFTVMTRLSPSTQSIPYPQMTPFPSINEASKGKPKKASRFQGFTCTANQLTLIAFSLSA